MKVAIVDDENDICSFIEQSILNYFGPNHKKSDISVYYSGEKFCLALLHEAFDIVFLDIELGGCSGIDVGRFIRESMNDHKTQIVYITGKTGYDRQLFDFQPFGFIAKPIEYFKINDIIAKYQKIYGNSNATFRYTLNHINCWVRISDIIYFESDGRKVNMYLNGDKEVISFYMKMSDIYKSVKEHSFLYIHKSYIVNELYISAFLSDFIILYDKKELPVSRLRRKEIMQRWIEIGLGD